jgi:hypothetical protein
MASQTRQQQQQHRYLGADKAQDIQQWSANVPSKLSDPDVEYQSAATQAYRQAYMELLLSTMDAKKKR